MQKKQHKLRTFDHDENEYDSYPAKHKNYIYGKFCRSNDAILIIRFLEEEIEELKEEILMAHLGDNF